MTGGSRGIGEMIAAGFLANGAKVYISSRKADVCDATAARLSEEYGGECISIPADLSELDGIDALAAPLAERESHLDVLVNNAGVSWGASIDEFPENGWDKVMDTNVKGVFFLTQTAAAAARGRRHRRGPGPGDQHRLGRRHPHPVVRHRVLRAVEGGGAHAHEPAGRQARASATSSSTPSPPGPFPTWMLSTGVGTGGDVEGTDWDALGRTMPRGRVGTPEDIAGLAIFLASRAGAFTVGAVITCDGGIVVS